jgi:hypothetical protein
MTSSECPALNSTSDEVISSHLPTNQTLALLPSWPTVWFPHLNHLHKIGGDNVLARTMDLSKNVCHHP